MTTNELSVATPCYVLLRDTEKIGPTILLNDPNARCVAIYGFSDKAQYDLFRENGDLSLRPYPLVKGYLKNQLSDDNGKESNCLRLVVLDSNGPGEKFIHASSMQAVLDAIVNRKPNVFVDYHLSLVQANNVYRLSEEQQCSVGSGDSTTEKTQ
jgi:hypothetical protein